MHSPLFLKGKTALITGASRGIGAAIAQAFAAEGAAVIVNYVSNREKADAVVTTITEAGGRALAVQADIGDLNQHQALITRAEAEFGPMAILVNNAAVETRKGILDYTPGDWDHHFNINLKGTFFLAQRAARQMIAHKIQGCIINISSTHESRPMPGNALYNISKAGVAMLTKSLALDLAPHGIRVNSLIPGAILTDINREVLANPEHKARVLSKIPLGCIGQPRDCIAAALLLANQDASYITGTSITVDGGLQL